MAEQRYSNLSESEEEQTSDYGEVRHEGLLNGGDATATLTLDDDELLEYMALMILKADGKEYIALMPESGEDGDGNVSLYHYAETKDGQPDLTDIENDEECEIANDAFGEILDEEEFKEFTGGEGDGKSED